jgi:hypothetical protein
MANALTHIVTKFFKPRFEEYGFSSFGSRMFLRLEGDIVQYISIVKSVRTSYFEVVCSSIPIFVPTENFHLSHAKHLQRDGRENGSWSSKHIEVAESAAKKVIREFDSANMIDWFESTKTIKGLIKHLESFSIHGFNGSHIELAACLAFGGCKEEALEVINDALTLDSYNPIQLGYLKVLSEGLFNGEEKKLLSHWYDGTFHALKLEKAK